MAKIYQIHPEDNAVVALENLAKGSRVSLGGKELLIQQDIPAGHKVALCAIKAGETVRKYGFSIGVAKEDVLQGAWLHTHNVKSCLGSLLEYAYHPEKKEKKASPPAKSYAFAGYARKDGRVGIRNEVWIIPTVGCVNAIARLIEMEAQQFLTAHIDGIYAYNHPHGCSQLGDDQLHTQRILSGLVNSPNAGAVLVLGLGCENNQIEQMKKMGGAAAMHDERLGSLAVGKAADCVALDLTSPNMQPVYNVVSHLVYAATGMETRMTMVDGEILYMDGKYTRFDYEALCREMTQVRNFVRRAAGLA